LVDSVEIMHAIYKSPVNFTQKTHLQSSLIR